MRHINATRESLHRTRSTPTAINTPARLAAAHNFGSNVKPTLDEVHPIVKRIFDAAADLNRLRDTMELSARQQQVAGALAQVAAERERDELQAGQDKLIDVLVEEIISSRPVTRRAITFRLRKAGVSESAIAEVLQRLIYAYHLNSSVPRVIGIRPRTRKRLTRISLNPSSSHAA